MYSKFKYFKQPKPPKTSISRFTKSVLEIAMYRACIIQILFIIRKCQTRHSPCLASSMMREIMEKKAGQSNLYHVIPDVCWAQAGEHINRAVPKITLRVYAARLTARCFLHQQFVCMKEGRLVYNARVFLFFTLALL